jgi:hypothetical protein
MSCSFHVCELKFVALVLHTTACPGVDAVDVVVGDAVDAVVDVVVDAVEVVVQAVFQAAVEARLMHAKSTCPPNRLS